MKLIAKTVLVAVAMTGASLVVEAQDVNESFREFRKQMMDDYHGFCKKVLDDYAKYLDGVWKDFEAFKGVERDTKPKPVDVPKTLPTDDAPSVDIPSPGKPADEVVPPKGADVSVPHVEVPQPLAPVDKMTRFSFYGMEWQGPSVDLDEVAQSAGKDRSLGTLWQALHDHVAKRVMPHLKALAVAHNLNDWFVFEMLGDYAEAVRGGEADDVTTLLHHCLLVNWGFDVRLARSGEGLCLLVPISQQVYSRSFLVIDGQKYYLFANQADGNEQQTISTCSLPNDADCGRAMNLLCGPVKVRGANQCLRTFSDGVITLTATVDVAVMEMLRHYPQMDIPCYAQSVIMPQVHEMVLDQLRPQIEGLSKAEAANKLIHFVQHAFDYATDDEQHGYEKPYFLEENFYYPKNDCEDRAVFYAFLVRNLLGLDVHLIHFPGHECTAVCFDDPMVKGTGYEYEGRRFIICDPTYIGASIGMCMPDYLKERPQVELW